MTLNDLFCEGLKELGIPPSPEKTALLELFLNELSHWNSIPGRKIGIGLVRASEEEIVIRHILDSLAALPVIREFRASEILDIGSGGGFPGIPLAIFLPNTSITLLERSARKAAYLRWVKASLKLDNVIVMENDLREINNTYDLIVFRAFSKIPDIIDKLLKITSLSGKIAAYKGKTNSIETEIEPLYEYKGKDKIRDIEVIPLKTPFLNEERNLLVISK